MSEKVEHIHSTGAMLEPMKIKLEKNSKGFNWEISIHGKDLAEILPKLEEANQALQGKYGGA